MSTNFSSHGRTKPRGCKSFFTMPIETRQTAFLVRVASNVHDGVDARFDDEEASANCGKCVGYSSNNNYFAADPMKASATRLGLALAVLVFSHSVLSLDPSTAITQYHQNVWGEGEGLPQGSVQAITQTRDGYLWVGTRDGLARFDGVKFTVFHTENSPGLAGPSVFSICEDGQGRLWLGTSGGVNWFSQGRFNPCALPDGWLNTLVRKVYVDRNGVLWIGSFGDGLARLENGKYTGYSTKNGLPDDRV